MLKRGFRLTLVCKTEILENNLRCLHVPDCRTNCRYSPLGFFVPGKAFSALVAFHNQQQ